MRITRLFGIFLSLFLFPILIGCVLDVRPIPPVPVPEPAFNGCFEKDAPRRGWIRICPDGYDQLNGTGSGLFFDGNDSNTVLLIHGDTNITDEALGPALPIIPKIITANGNAAVQEAFSRSWEGSISFDGTGDYLTTPDHADFDFSDGTWTIDFWIYNLADNVGRIFYQQTDDDNYISLYNTNSTLYFRIYSGGSAVVLIGCPAGSLSDNAWHHVALVENGDNYYIFIDGALQGSTTDTDRPANYTGTVYIGSMNGTSGYLNAYLDEFRVSRIARHTANFTPLQADLEWVFTGTVTSDTDPPTANLTITEEPGGRALFTVNAEKTGSNSLSLQRSGDPFVPSLSLTRVTCPADHTCP